MVVGAAKGKAPHQPEDVEEHPGAHDGGGHLPPLQLLLKRAPRDIVMQAVRCGTAPTPWSNPHLPNKCVHRPRTGHNNGTERETLGDIKSMEQGIKF